MTTLDTMIVIAWLAITSVVGIWAGLRSTMEGFWVNKRATRVPWLVFTIVATQVGGGTVVGITSSSYTSGIGFGLVAIISTVAGFIAIALLAPWAKSFGDRNRAYTLPEVLGKRYGRRVQVVAAILILFAYLSLLAGQFLSVAVLLQVWTGWSAEVTLLLGAALAIGYSAFAGLRGDIITDAMHFWVKAVVLFLIVLPCIAMKEPLLTLLANVPARIWSPVTFGGYTYLIAGVALGALIPIVSMEMWMRVYAATDKGAARRAFVWSAIAVVPFYVFPLFLGVAATQLQLNPVRPDALLVEVFFKYLPPGVLGIAVAGLLAVVVSSANTMVVVLGAVLYKDILNRKGTESSTELWLSRGLTFGSGIIGFGFAVIVPSIVQLVLNAFFVIGMISPVLLGLTIWRRATRAGAFWALVVGGIVTVSCLPSMPQQAFLPGLVLAVLLFFGVSLLTRHHPVEDLSL